MDNEFDKRLCNLKEAYYIANSDQNVYFAILQAPMDINPEIIQIIKDASMIASASMILTTSDIIQIEIDRLIRGEINQKVVNINELIIAKKSSGDAGKLP